MSNTPSKFKRESAQQRKEDLIRATLSLISEHGVRGATVRAIAERAEVTQGLIRHYFLTKEDLIVAAYEYHMEQMTDIISASIDLAETSPRERLGAFVSASLKSPIVDPGSVTIWASFLNKVREKERMRKMHQQTYYAYRDRLEGLICDALDEAGIVPKALDVRRMAIASNAVIDGLWMEGGALPGAFELTELPLIGLNSVGAIIGIDLDGTVGSP
jgi:AcrR family transcriptional regulator